jgi:hypothetical protein
LGKISPHFFLFAYPEECHLEWKNGQFIFGIQQNATSYDIAMAIPFRLNGLIWPFKPMSRLRQKAAIMIILDGIGIWCFAQVVFSRYRSRRKAHTKTARFKFYQRLIFLNLLANKYKYYYHYYSPILRWGGSFDFKII